MEVEPKESWNYKRIFIALFLLIVLIIGGYYINSKVLGNKINIFSKSSKTPEGILVKGASTKDVTEVKINMQEALKERVDSIKKEVGNLNVVDVATSSPPVQKILNDIKALEQYPGDQIKNICKTICGQ